MFKRFYISAYKAMFIMLAATACQQERVPASLTLEFNITEPVMTRGDSDSADTELYFEVKDGRINPCDAMEYMPDTKAGDSNVEDGGGMADLTVFLVDDKDNIVARSSISDMSGTTVRQLNFPDLEQGNYTVYAYANTEGNDWFNMPDEDETSFSEYKDALLKPLTDGVPDIGNDRMPLTGWQDISLTGGSNSRTVEMLRPVGKLSIKVINKTSSVVNTNNLSFDDILPYTGYVFRHDQIYSKDDDNNPYYPISNNSDRIYPYSEEIIYESLMYEAAFDDDGVKITMKYEVNNHVYENNLSDRLNQIKDESNNILIKIYDGDSDESNDLFLRLNEEKILEAVGIYDLDDYCYWSLGSAGGNIRPIINLKHNLYLHTDDLKISFNTDKVSFRFDKGDYTHIINKDNYDQLKYDPESNKFSVVDEKTDTGSLFQFFTYIKNSTTGEFESHEINILEYTEETTKTLLREIRRNQHIKLNIIFK